MTEATFTTEEAATLLRMKPEAVQKLCRLRKLDARKVGRRYLIRQSELDRITAPVRKS